MILHVIPDRTGDPLWDNRARNFNRDLTRHVRRNGFRVHAKSRRRRAQIRRAEEIRYAELLVSVMDHIVTQEAADA